MGLKADEHRQRIRKAFSSLVDKALTEKVDLFLIAGDLFDSNAPHAGTLSFAVNEIQRLTSNGIFVAMVAGNHDPYDAYSVYRERIWHNLEGRYFRFFTENSVTVWEIEELDLAICGYSLHTNKTSKNHLAGFKYEGTSTYKIGLFHGSLAIDAQLTNTPLEIKDFKATNLDYIALGDWHGQLEVLKKAPTVWYSGSPEVIASDQRGAGHALFVEISGTGEVNVTSLECGTLQIALVEVDVSNMQSLEAVASHVSNKVARPERSILEVRLKGIRSEAFNPEDLESILKDKFYLASVKDVTKFEFSPEQVQALSGKLITGRLIKYLEEYKKEHPEAEAVANLALQKGLHYLSPK